MIKINTGETINIVELEDMLKWCRYKNNLTSDILIMGYIKKIYGLLGITEKDKTNTKFSIGMMRADDYEHLKLIQKQLILFNINEQAELKLTKDELRMCKDHALKSSLEEIDKIDNFYVRSYSHYLSINASNSKVSNEISERVKKQSQGLREKIKKIDHNQACSRISKPKKRG